MADCGLLDLTCRAGNAATSVFEQIAQAAAQAAVTVIGSAMTWWLHTPSVDPDSAAIHHLQQDLTPVVALILVASILTQCLRMVLTRKKDPALNIGLGLLRYVVTTAVALSLLAVVLKAGDDFAAWLARDAVGQFAERMKGLLTSQLLAANPFLQIVLAGWALLLGAVQWLLGLLREGGILVFAAVLPLAAAGGMNEATKPMLPRIISPLAALVFYKPIAAIIYTIGFELIGTGQDLSTIFTGLVVLVLASVAMPAMMRFFAFTQVQMSSGSGVSGALAAGATGAASLAMLRGAAAWIDDHHRTRHRAPGRHPRQPIPRQPGPRRPGPRRPCSGWTTRRRSRGRPAGPGPEPHPTTDTRRCRRRSTRRHRIRRRRSTHRRRRVGARGTSAATGAAAGPAGAAAAAAGAAMAAGRGATNTVHRRQLMTTVADRSATPRTYGNWYKARGFGIGQLGAGQTITLFFALLVPIAIAYVSGRAALVAGGAALVVIAATVIRIDGQSLADVGLRRVRFTRARAAGWTELSGGILADHPRGHDLPGPMAPLVALSAEDGRGGKQGLLWDRHTGRLTAILRVSPVGLDLADPAQADAWVAGWAALLANLGFLPLVRHIAVTVDTCPAGGTTLRDYVTARIDPAAPAPARAVLDELLAATPTISADVDTRVAVTFDPARATPKPADLLAAVAEVIRWLPGIEASLTGCGVALQGRASVGWLTGRLRLAYDPAGRADVTRLADRATTPIRSWCCGARPGRSARGKAGNTGATTPASPWRGRWSKRPAKRSSPGC